MLNTGAIIWPYLPHSKWTILLVFGQQAVLHQLSKVKAFFPEFPVLFKLLSVGL